MQSERHRRRRRESLFATSKCRSSDYRLTPIMSLEEVVLKEVQNLYNSRPKNDDESIESLRLTVMGRVARALSIPLDPTDFAPASATAPPSRIVVSHQTLRELDAVWYRSMYAFSDIRISNQEKLIRGRLFLNAPYYVDIKVLAKFVDILVKKDAVRGTGFEGDVLFKNAKTDERPMKENESADITPVMQQKSNRLNKLLAVDGFRGTSPSLYKNYVGHLNDRLPETEKKHVAGVRAMYYRNRFAGGRHTGSVAAACVFLVLLKLYRKVTKGRMEDFVQLAIDKTVGNLVRFVEDSEGGDDFKDGVEYKKLENTYRKKFRKSQLEWIALEKLKEFGKIPDAKRSIQKR